MSDAMAIPMRLPCPVCGDLHIDEGEFATKPHHTHACQKCGNVWRPAIIATVGVRFLPGFKNSADEIFGDAAIADEIFEEGYWRSCTGCHELNEGHPTGPYSSAFRCNLGGGCRECGGIGAVWEAISGEE